MALKPLNSVAGFSVGETPANIILANGDITTNNITTTGIANLNNISNVKIFGGSNGQVLRTDGLGNLTFYTIGESSLANGTSNLEVLLNSNITFSVAGISNVLVVSNSGAYINGLISVTGNAIVGNVDTAGVFAATISASGNANVGNLGTTGIIASTISASGNANLGNLDTNAISANSLTVSGNANLGNLNTGTISATGNIDGANFNTGGVISATGTITGGNLATAGTLSAGGNANVGNLGTSGVVTATGTITGGNLATGGTLSVTGNATVGNLSTAGTISATGNVSAGNFETTGTATVGNFTISQFISGNLIPSADVTYSLGNSTNKWNDLYLSGNTIYLGNITLQDSDGALLVSGLSVTGNANIGNIGTTGVLTASGNVTGANLLTTGIISAGGNANVGNLGTGGLITATGNIDGGNLNTAGSLSVGGNANVGNLGTGGLVTATGNGTFGNVITGGLVTATGNVTGGNITTAGLVTATGNVTGGNITTTGEVTATGNGTFGNVNTGGLLTVTGNANVGNLGTAGLITATGNIDGGNLNTSGALSAGGNANVGNLGTAGLITATGNIDGGNLNTSGALSAGGNANVGNLGTGGLITATGTVTGGNLATAGTLSVGGNANIGNVSVSGNVQAGGVLTNNLYYANGQPWDLQEAAGANYEIQFNIGNNFAASPNLTFDGNILTVNGNANVTGSVNTDDINSGSNSLVVNANGFVTTFAANGTVTFPGNISAGNIAGNITGNISGNITIPGPNTAVVWNANGVANTDANFTFDYTTDTMAVPNISTPTGSNANLTLEPDGSGIVVIANTAGGATGIQIGTPTLGNLISNAVSLTNSSSVSNAIAQLNEILGKLVPPAPPAFPASQTISIQSLSTYRMANFVQTDNTPGANKSVAGGTTVTTVRRASSYTTGNITTAGPGDSGTVTAFLNGANAGSRTLTTAINGNGTYSNLVIFNNYDYNVANANINAGFWYVFSSRAAGTVTEGWNEVYISQSAAGNTNTTVWYYDASTPGTPTFSNVSFVAPTSPTYEYSSTVPHYPNTNQFVATFDVNRLSGDMYPTSDNFITGTAGGAFSAPASVSYASAGVTTPLSRNLYVSSGNVTVTTTANVISGFGSSSGSASLSAFNSYNTGTQSLSPGNIVLYKTGTTSSASRIEEANVFISGTIGTGSGLAFRIVNPGSTNTPSYSASAAAFNSQSSTLETYDATVVANVLRHDQTNYSTGYLPAGPNLSVGRSGTQYFTFKFVRTSVSKFDIRWTGNIAGLWYAVPGSTIDSTSTLNGWIDLSVAYAGAGVPGANTGAGGNGSNGGALGGVAPLNSAQTNKAVTATFGTVSSSSTATNEIYVRIALTSGQSVTALSLQPASN